MAKIKNPISFSEHFKIAPSKLKLLGVFNPTLNVDTKLFIDPVLLEKSQHSEFSKNAISRYRKYFEDIITLLKASKFQGDIAWRNAERRLRFSEIPFTCLGYGAATIHGSAWGRSIRNSVLATGKEIIDLGVEDPELFSLMALFEAGVGPDRISDMTTRIILEDIVFFTSRISSKLKIPTNAFKISGQTWQIPRNPKESKFVPVFLLPLDILRSLPVASDWSEVDDVVSENETIRNRVNKQIGEIWKAKTRKEKEKLREVILSNKTNFMTLLNAIKESAVSSYDFGKDKEGVIIWRRVNETIAGEYPLVLKAPKTHTLDSLYKVVDKIIDNFYFLIENRITDVLWDGDRPRKERNAQMIFFAVADSYCKANNLDITPEADTGSGEVDFKFSFGYEFRVLVETKLSTNPKLVDGYTKQLEIYKKAEKTTKGVYLVIDVGKIMSIKNDWKAEGKPVSDLYFVDGNKKPSASKR
jgi:hypothetical protein